MEVNKTCGLRGSCYCFNGDDNKIDTILYFIMMIWIAVFIVGVKIKKE